MDIACYLTESEQIPSAVALGVFVEKDWSISAAGGFLVQALPPSDDAVMDELADRLHSIPAVTGQIRNGGTPESMLKEVFGDLSYKILETKPVFFKCLCSRERIEQALALIGIKGLEDVIKDQTEIEIKCEMCRKAYIFKSEDIDKLIKEIH
jgi:molecular chaperone Hsp33